MTQFREELPVIRYDLIFYYVLHLGLGYSTDQTVFNRLMRNVPSE